MVGCLMFRCLPFIVVNAILFIVVAYFVNEMALLLSIPILIILAAYTVFKRFSAAAHLILGVSLGLAPIAGVVAVTGDITEWSIYLAVGVMFWVAGFDLLYSLQDIEFDKEKWFTLCAFSFWCKKHYAYC